MSGPSIDLTGKTFGRLTVIRLESYRSPGGHSRWYCECECGGNRIADGASLNRRRHGWSDEDILTVPIGGRRVRGV